MTCCITCNPTISQFHISNHTIIRFLNCGKLATSIGHPRSNTSQTQDQYSGTHWNYTKDLSTFSKALVHIFSPCSHSLVTSPMRYFSMWSLLHDSQLFLFLESCMISSFHCDHFHICLSYCTWLRKNQGYLKHFVKLCSRGHFRFLLLLFWF